ncbi:MAG: helix-turn-helix transcriptional regulator [Bacteroides sp.]|nr:helix-turn-helix transcriptional regulator [Bacteroides sp.]
MNNDIPYSPSDKLRSLIRDNSLLLMVMSRFGISLGFGNKNVNDICEQNKVDTATFLTVANFISKKECSYKQVSLASLIHYLKRAHNYFLDFNLPTIRRRLIEAIDCSGTDEVALLILKFYDEYVIEVRRHMEYENETVFGYVEDLLQGRYQADYNIRMFADKHNDIAPKLEELKDIIIRYYPQKENDMLNSVLFDIINCEQDLTSHCLVEDHLFVPAVELMEEELKTRLTQSLSKEEEPTETDKPETLSQREKEIVSCVAKGLTNKEIAEVLFLSVHTVATHRRNISSKLQIHTPAGLTIYAIINKLVKLEDIKMS